jgi:ribose transport system substrate-binding protein
MVNRRTFVCALAAGSAALALDATTVAFGPGAFAQVAGKKYRIVFANYSDEAVFGAAVRHGVQNAAKAHSNVDVIYFDNKQDAAKSIENARTIIAAKPDLVLWYTTFPDVNKRAAQLFDEAKLPIITVQTPALDAPMFAVDNKLSGEESGNALAEKFKNKWPSAVPVALILGWPEQGPLFIDRAEAAKKAILEALPKTTISEFSTTGDPNRARQVTADFLTQHPGAKAMIWAHVDAMGVSALAAARNAGREGDVLIATTGGDRSVFPELRKPDSAFIGTFSFFPENWGDDLIDLAVKELGGAALPKHISPRKQLFLTYANLKEYYPQ